jgi:hypothetical protein
MTLAGLSECLGVPARTLYRWRRSFPNQVPKDFELESWREFIGKVRNYSADRTRPKDRNGNGTESSAEDQNGEYSAAVEGRERIIKLRLSNEARRTSLEVLRQNTITVSECEATMNRIRSVVSAELLKLPGNLSPKLANREPAYIQQVLDATLRSSLDG